MHTIIVLSMAERIAAHFQSSPTELVTVLLATLPIVELRGAIPWAMAPSPGGGMEWTQAVPLSIIGNMIPIPFILLFLGPAEKFLCRWSFFRKFFDWLFARTRKRSKLIEKYGAIALILFVGIPLPITGGWTGSVAAYLLDIPFWKALIFIFIGVCIASVIVTIITLGGLGIFHAVS